MDSDRALPRRKTVAEQAAAFQRWEARCQFVDGLRADIGAAMPDVSEFVRARTLTEVLLVMYLGEEWVDKNVTRSLVSARPGPGKGAEYLRRDADWTRLAAAQHYQRSTELARRLFEFEDEPFFDTLRANVLRNDLEGAAFEADVVRMVMALHFAFISLGVVSGKRGQDYDIDVRLAADRLWAIEAKTRAEESAYSEKSLLNTLRHARKQLPESGLGSIFVKLPFGWVSDEAFVREHEAVVMAFLGGTARVHAVIFVWEQYTFDDEESKAWSWDRDWSVHRSRTIDPDLSELLDFYEAAWRQPFSIVAPDAPF